MHLVARRAAEFGVEVEGQVRFHLDQAVARKDSIVKGIHESIHGALEGRKKEIVATGARRAVPPIPGLEEVEPLDNKTSGLAGFRGPLVPEAQADSMIAHRQPATGSGSVSSRAKVSMRVERRACSSRIFSSTSWSRAVIVART